MDLVRKRKHLNLNSLHLVDFVSKKGDVKNKNHQYNTERDDQENRQINVSILENNQPHVA